METTSSKLTVREYSDVIGCTRQSIYSKIKRGTINYVVEDGTTYIVEPIQTTMKTTFTDEPTKNDDNVVGLLTKELKGVKKLNRKLLKKIDKRDNEIARLNDLLVEKTGEVSEVLKQYIGQMTQLLPSPTTDLEDIKVKNRKKKSKSKKH